MKARVVVSVIRLFLLAGAALVPLGLSSARAGEGFAPTAADPDLSQCKTLGEGFYAVKGSVACARISGHIAAGVEFAAPGHLGAAAQGSFAPHPAAGADTHAGATMDARFDTEFGPDRLYIRVGKDQSSAP